MRYFNFILMGDARRCILLVLPVATLVNTVVCKDLTVETKLGKIRGVRAEDGNFTMYMGIPYATVDPDHPFGKSIPNPKFEGTFQANDDTTRCPQVEEFNLTASGTLDCLRLNIYVPDTSSSKLLPVMFFIHGGGFYLGFASRFLYGPKFLVRHGIILVTFNYRLGPYGFFCLDTPEIPGNQGLQDMVTALRWIKDNIADFGGDPNEVTISGHSTGAVAVELLILAPIERLFQKAIIQSSSALMKDTVTDTANRTKPVILANYLGSNTNDTEQAVEFLAKSDVLTVIEATKELRMRILPCVHKNFEGVENIIPIHPKNAMYKATNLAIMLGYTNDEMSTCLGGKPPDHYVNYDFIDEDFKTEFKFNESYSEEMERIVRRFYIGEREMNYETKDEILEYESDFTYLHPLERSLDRYLADGAYPVYQYLFSYLGRRNFAKFMQNLTGGGAGHADELGYLFDGSYLSGINCTDDDLLMIDRLTTLWANFVKYSDPTPTMTDILPVKWLPVTSQENRNYVRIDKIMSTGKRPFHKNMAFWDLFYLLNEKLQKHYKNEGIHAAAVEYNDNLLFSSTSDKSGTCKSRFSLVAILMSVVWGCLN